MRRIERTATFRRDYKREKRGQHGEKLDALFASVVTSLADDKPLPLANRDHPLAGKWADHRDCHMRPDLVLIYSKPDQDTLKLVRLGSHAELFG